MNNIGEKNPVNTISEPDTLLIGVGASAGGLDAFYSLFNQDIPSNVTFIVIQHLSPNFTSITADLLSSHCHRKVNAIEDNMPIEANAIYVLTERRRVEIHEGKFHLTDLEPGSINNTLDCFFKSLAAEQGNQSVAIILSGGGNDGTAGAEAVKKAGGMVIVQDPGTSEFSSMPSSVIAAGYADSILAPALMIQEISEYLKQNTLFSQFTDNNEALLRELLDLISKNTPLDFSNYKRATIVRRIIRKMNQCNIALLADFIQFLKDNPAAIDLLSKEFMISVTKFFRDAVAFEFLKERVLSDILEKKEHDASLKIWVVGCATGEEAYSIAILIHERLEEMKKSMDVKIFASDIDKNALSVASKGVYPESIAGDVSEERLLKYFYREGGKYKIKEPIRNMLIIAQHDITKHPPYYKLDLISCRNLLIYMNPELQKKILATLHYCLNPGGYLFLGPSESLGDVKSKFSEEHKKWKIFKNVESARRLENGTYSTPSFYIKPPIKAMPVLRSTNATPPESIHEIIAETLALKTNHAGVCIDENYKILKTFGDYKRYLLPEMFNFNLLQVLPHELSIVTATGLNQAVRENREITIRNVVFIQNDSARSITIYIKPLSGYKAQDEVMLVSFTEEAVEGRIENAEIFNKELHTNRYLLDLEEELKETQKKLNDAYDALETSNIHAQSFNEELISGNEELQSTNEEVQSVNEELHTVNNQYQLKIKELLELNDDLNNYFRSTINGHIYVDRNFIIRKFTASAVKQINLKDSDIGRPISDISTNIKFSNLMEDIHSVVASSHLIVGEIETLDRKWYQMVLHPYVRQQDDKTDGVIISFNDITDLKIAQKRLIKINEDHNTFIYSVSHDLNVPVANIEGLISSLSSMVSGPEHEGIREISELITLSVKKLRETIEELSDIPRIEKESAEEIQETVNVQDIYQEIRLSIDALLTKSGAKISIDLQEQEIPFAKKNLRSILLNLLTNAIKYKSPERDPEILIRTERSGEFIILSVKDNGMGITKENKAKLFSMFKRVHEENDIEGSGIGLFLVKKIVTNAGGKIKVESEKGKGSVFKVWFKS